MNWKAEEKASYQFYTYVHPIHERHPHWLSLTRLHLLMFSTNFLLIIDAKSLLMNLKHLVARYCNRYQRSLTCWKAGYTVDNIHWLMKYISFRQPVNGFANIGDNPGPILITTAGILSGRLVFLEWRLPASCLKKCKSLCSMRGGRSSKKWFLSYI